MSKDTELVIAMMASRLYTEIRLYGWKQWNIEGYLLERIKAILEIEGKEVKTNVSTETNI
jgi:hypothetical protein